MASHSVLGQILLIADDTQAMSRVLLRDGYQVMQFSNGNDAVSFSTQISCDVAVIDLNVSGLSGMETVRRLKALGSDVEVITLTGLSGSLGSDVSQSDFQRHVFDCLYTPVDLAVLQRTVRRAVDRRALLQENRRLHQAVVARHAVSSWAAFALSSGQDKGGRLDTIQQAGGDHVSRLHANEMKTIVAALKKARWNRRHTAMLLNISYSALRRRITKYGITPNIDTMQLADSVQ